MAQAAEERQARARSLSDIAFDSSAELEYRAAYAVTHSPKFLIDAAGAAIAAGHYGAGMAAVRQAIPQLEARRIADIPNEAWRAAFPLPYELNLRSAAARNQLDPMLIAGLIRQESAFESKAMSHAGAIGLMQVEPATALKLARQLKVRYARARLTDPGYNLQLGSRYLANLIQSFGTPEAALAAYNAGEDHVMEWTTGQNYLETAEFVESIPFTETREYVQIVIRNSDVYRQVYRPSPLPSPSGDRRQTRLSRKAALKAAVARPAAAPRSPGCRGAPAAAAARDVGTATRVDRRNPLSAPSRLSGADDPSIIGPKQVTTAVRRMLSAKAERFTESVIREMTRLAFQYDAVNMAQGFPDFPASPEVKEAARQAISDDINQYAITWGAKELRDAIARKFERTQGVRVDPEREITVTCGSTEAMMATMMGLINPGDEVVIFEPHYENYGPDAILSGATPRFVQLQPPHWNFDRDELTRAFGPKTKAIIVNTPNNPTGKVFSREELEFIRDLCVRWNAFAVTDEIYEHIIYDGRQHISMASLDGMRDRTITINGMSKTYSVTGWRVGWAIAPPEASIPIRKVHDFLTVGAAAPLQQAGRRRARIAAQLLHRSSRRLIS